MMNRGNWEWTAWPALAVEEEAWTPLTLQGAAGSLHRRSDAQKLHQPPGIDGRAHLPVRVEAEEDVTPLPQRLRHVAGTQGVLGLPACSPGLDARGPAPKRTLVATAGVELFGAVQPAIGEICA